MSRVLVHFKWNATQLRLDGGEPLQVAAIVVNRVDGPVRESVDAAVGEPCAPAASETKP